MRLLAADIGGTNSRFAEFETASALGTSPEAPLRLVRTVTLPTASASSFADLMARLAKVWGPLDAFDRAALAIPGPVTQQRVCVLPNVPWGVVDLDTVPGLPPTVLLNDFVAQGWACLHPEAQDLELVCGPNVPPGHNAAYLTRGVIGPGTGLGLCAVPPVSLVPPGPGNLAGLTPDGTVERAPCIVASEGGHALFPFLPCGAPGAGADEFDFAAFLQHCAGCTAVELVVAGRGLSHLHAYYTGEDLSPAEVAACMHETPVLAAYARYFGRACQQWILYTTCSGGLYIAGGIAAANPAVLKHPAFGEGLFAVQKHEALVRETPIWLVRNTQAALWGAAAAAAMDKS